MKPEAVPEALIARQVEPFNGGPRLDRLTRRFVTPTDHFFVRTHGTVPTVDPDAYRLVVEGDVERPLVLSLDELRLRFHPASTTATLQCAGNRRAELLKVAPLPGEVPWGAEAIGNAEWTGVRLSDVLAAAGVRDGARHVAFARLDSVERQGHDVGFGGSLTLEKARRAEVLLAFAMNGNPLTPEHGFPLRVVAPGVIGARSVKWLRSVRVQADPSDHYFQRSAYRMFPPHATATDADWDGAPMLAEMPVSSVIASPADGARVARSPLDIEGYAVSGTGWPVTQVEISIDDGRTWLGADLLDDADPNTWRRWARRIDVAPQGAFEILVRARDAAGHGQPERLETVWNFKGYLNNAWHRVGVTGA